MSENTYNLHKFVEEGNTKAVMEIIKQGGLATVNTPNEQRVFPLHVAAQTGNATMVELLLKHGAKVTCVDDKGLTPLHYAVRAGNKETVNVLLRQNGIQVDSPCHQFWTPLHYATYHRHSDIVTMLCEAKANLEETDVKAKTPLHLACIHGFKDIILTLITYGAKLDHKDTDNFTPIELLQLRKPPASPPRNEPSNLEMLSREMKSLLYSPEFSDITFVFDAAPVDKVPAHRNILKARAPLLLKDAGSESGGRNQTVRLPGMSAAAFRLMLEWIYTANIEIDEVDLEVAFELYNKADDYKLPRLRAFVENVITSNIDESNTKSVFDSAISFKATGIVEKCSVYIVEHFHKILSILKTSQQPLFTKDDYLEIFHHINIQESIPADVASEPRFSNLSPVPAGGETSASYSNASGSLKVKIQRPPATRTGAVRQANPKKVATTTPYYSSNTPVAPTAATSAQTSTSSASLLPPAPAPHLSPASPSTPSSAGEKETDKKSGGSNNTDAKKMQGKTLELCRQVIGEMMEDPRAPEFNSPVDWEGLNLIDYPHTIKRPMDLGTISKNLKQMTDSTTGKNTQPKKKIFKYLKDFAADVRLVFDNARVYNMSGSNIYLQADELASLFETKYNNLKKTLGINKQYDPPKPFQPPPPIELLPADYLAQSSYIPNPSPASNSKAVAKRSTNTSATGTSTEKKNVKRKPTKTQTPPQRSPTPSLPPATRTTPSVGANSVGKQASEPRGVKTQQHPIPASSQPPQKKRKVEATTAPACNTAVASTGTPTTPTSMSSAPQSTPPQPKSSAPAAATPTPYENSLILHQQLSTLATQYEWAEAKILNIINPTGNPSGETEMEIDLDTLPASTLRKLQEFVDEHTKALDGNSVPSASSLEGTPGAESEEDLNDTDFH